MNKHTVAVVCFCLAACGSETASSQDAVKTAAAPAAGAMPYEMKTIKEKIPDKSSPLGYWDINKSYPVIQGATTQGMQQSLNQKIAAIANQYSCDGKGEENFTGKVMLSNAKVFSMRYESMWMCAQMPAPDSTSGTVNIDVRNGTDIELGKEFANAAAHAAFVEKSLKQLNQKIAEQGKKQQVDCAALDQLGPFYVTAAELVLTTPADGERDPACTAELAIPRQNLSAQLKADSALRP